MSTWPDIRVLSSLLLGRPACSWRSGSGSTYLRPQTKEREYRRTYYAGFSQVLESEAAIWLLGRRSDWEGSVVDGTYRLCNVTGNANASCANRFSYVDRDNQPIEQSEAKASVRVSLQPPLGQYSGAGLPYRKRPDRPDHYVFMLTAGGTVSLARVGKSLQFLWSKELNLAATTGPVKLIIEGEGRELRLYVDDRLVHTATDDPPLSGDPGVFAMSTGCFVFDDVAVYLPAGRRQPTPRQILGPALSIRSPAFRRQRLRGRIPTQQWVPGESPLRLLDGAAADGVADVLRHRDGG